MRIIGCDLHARQQTLAMLDSTTGEVVKATLKHKGNMVREFYGKLPQPVRVGIEASGPMQWFVNLMEELGIECLEGHPAEIRAADHENKNMIGEMRTYSCHYWQKSAFRRSGYLRKNCWTCGPCCDTAISGWACGSKYKMRCRPLPGEWSPTRFLTVDASRPTGDRVFAVVAACRLSAE
jgi:hypothetical protein